MQGNNMVPESERDREAERALIAASLHLLPTTILLALVCVASLTGVGHGAWSWVVVRRTDVDVVVVETRTKRRGWAVEAPPLSEEDDLLPNLSGMRA